MSDFYILDDHTPVETDSDTWGLWYGRAEHRTVDRTERDDITVSTVFLGLNHNYGDGPPLIFETMIFGGPNDGWQDRCSTWAEAEAMHTAACRLAFPTH
jgi:hypothetical protein